MNTSALLTVCFSRERPVLGMLRSAGAALTVVITATIDRCLSVQVLPRRRYVFAVPHPLGSETLRPRTTRLGDPTDITGHVASTQILHPHLFVMELCTSRDA